MAVTGNAHAMPEVVAKLLAAVAVFAVATTGDVIISFAVFAVGALLGASLLVLADRYTRRKP